MKIITVTKDSANLDLTLDELIVLRNSLHHVLFETDIRELLALTGLYPYEMKQVLDSIEKIIQEF